MLATIQQNSNGVYQAAPGWSARPGHADEAGTVAGRAANAVALICYGCSNCHLSLLCYPLPGTDREPSDRPIGRLPEGSGDPPASTSAHEAGALDAASLIHFDVTGLLAWLARSTWSGRERSSHSRFPPVPRVGLVTFAFFCLLLHSVIRRFCMPVAVVNPCLVFAYCRCSHAMRMCHFFVKRRTRAKNESRENALQLLCLASCSFRTGAGAQGIGGIESQRLAAPSIAR